MNDDEILFYHDPQSRALIVHLMLEELGKPYRVQLVDLRKGEQRQAPYLAVNPMGKVPAIKHRGVVITEAAAICCYLADAFPDAKLNIPVGDPDRGLYLKWLFFGPGCLEPAVVDRMLKREAGSRGALGYGDFDTVIDVVARAVAPGPYLLGDRFTAADVVIGSGLAWGMMIKVIPERPEIVAYTKRLQGRAAAQRVRAKNVELGTALGR
jgi:glutathione S-transferase